jgi:hypothetical protein
MTGAMPAPVMKPGFASLAVLGLSAVDADSNACHAIPEHKSFTANN